MSPRGAAAGAGRPRPAAEETSDDTVRIAAADSYGDSLEERDVALIRASAISPEVARARGYRTVSRKADLRALGFSTAQQRAGLVIPTFGFSPAEPVLYQLRPHEPRTAKDSGVARKYETPTSHALRLDFPPTLDRKQLADPGVMLYVTEGIRKADALVSAGAKAVVGLLGVDGWRHGGAPSKDWTDVPLTGRQVAVVFDSDVFDRRAEHVSTGLRQPAAQASLLALKAMFEKRGATVTVIRLQSGPDGEKVGVDDFLARGKTLDDVWGCRLAADEVPTPPVLVRSPSYRAEPFGTVWLKRTDKGVHTVKLANFTARIVAEFVDDDGAEQRATYRIEAKLGQRVETFDIAASRYASLGWVDERLGRGAVVEVGQNTQRHLGNAIKELSPDCPREVRHRHTGWRDLPGVGPAYLHAGGAVGPVGPVPETRCDLGTLSAYALPDPPAGDELRAAVRTSLTGLELGELRVCVPILAAMYRAPLGWADFAVSIEGRSGSFKTALALAMLAHFGAEFGGRKAAPPGSWSSTGNALEGQAFLLKDAPFLIDDFNPSGSRQDQQRMHATADRVIRGAANWSPRARLNADETIRAQRPPRGLIVSTGEVSPAGESLNARMVKLPVVAGNIDSAKLADYQAAGAGGVLAGAMAGYLQWLAGRFRWAQQETERTVAFIREVLSSAPGHRRTPGAIANLAAGLDLFLRFAVDVGAVTEAEAAAKMVTAWKALTEVARDQVQQQKESDPIARFPELLASAIASGGAHVADPKGGPPVDPEQWGWRRVVTEGARPPEYAVGRLDPQGVQVGWLDGEDLYLNPETTVDVVRRVAEGEGGSWPWNSVTLGKRLHEADKLTSVEHDGESTRRTVKVPRGNGVRGFHLKRGLLNLSGQTGQISSEGPDLLEIQWTGSGFLPVTSRSNRSSAADHLTGSRDRSDRCEDFTGQGKAEQDQGFSAPSTGLTGAREVGAPTSTGAPAQDVERFPP